MSAQILSFTGKWQGHFEPQERPEPSPACLAFHDARAIREAKRDNDDWTARLLLALLQTLDSKQLELLEFRLLGQKFDDKSAVQSLAIVQYASGSKAHRNRVASALAALQERDR